MKNALTRFSVSDQFFGRYKTLMRDVVLPYQEKILKDQIPGAEPSNAIRNFELAAQVAGMGTCDGEFQGMIFQDSDVAKWLEAAAYSMVCFPDKELESRCDELIDLIGRAQMSDGYIKRNFLFTVNGVEIFCKGGNWVPADSIYARITPAKYRLLVQQAKDAHFNMLRVWGGGIYEPDVFFDACDEQGILLWHDFMFSCAAYPDHQPRFLELVGHELRYQIARLRNHPSLALWCGNNENQMTFNPRENPQWRLDMCHERQYGMYISNNLVPDAVHALSGEIPYWPSSPYGGELPNAEEEGDAHYWNAWTPGTDALQRVELRTYDRFRARFVSEYGFPGPCRTESVKEYLQSADTDRSHPFWNMHVNTCENLTVSAGIYQHYGREAGALSMKEYELYAGLVQSLVLNYSLESIRFHSGSGGALFWMFNDAWGEVGWSIVDYYLRRKIAYYGVKRAFAPVKLILRETGGEIALHACNDTEHAVLLRARAGFMYYDGTFAGSQPIECLLAPRSRMNLSQWGSPKEDCAGGAFAVLPSGSQTEPCALHGCNFKNQKRLPPSFTVTPKETD